MPVVQVTDHEPKKLAPDHVYVIAPDRQLVMIDSCVAASPFTQPGGPRTAIDLFFRSLAAAHGDGFAVVLSGSGSDGAVGAKAVKESGGLVLVQDPSEAAHGGMPRAAIAKGVADVVLPVRDLVTRLADLSRNKHRINPVVRAPDPVRPIPEDEESALERVLDTLRTRSGHDFSGYTRGTVLRRLSRRMQLSDRRTIRDYLALVRDDVAESEALLDDLLISVTTFFRDPDAWKALRAQVIAPLVAQAPLDEPIRVWVPGCATGEEAYTLAILFHEEFESGRGDRELTIFASDVDAGALAVARDAVYPQAITADVSDERLERFFRREGDHYRVIPRIREHLVFAEHSLLRDPPFSRLQLISCRNILIYLDRQWQAQAMGIFRYACGTDGFLFLGSSELADADLFEPVDARHRVYRAREGATAAAPGLSGPAPRRPPGPRPIAERPAPASSTASELHADALEELRPADGPARRSMERAARCRRTRPGSSSRAPGPLAKRATDLVRSELRHPLHALLLSRVRHGIDAGVAVHGGPLRRHRAPRVDAGAAASAPNGSRQVLLTFLDLGEFIAQGTAGRRRGLRDAGHAARDAEHRIENMREAILCDRAAARRERRAAEPERGVPLDHRGTRNQQGGAAEHERGAAGRQPGTEAQAGRAVARARQSREPDGGDQRRDALPRNPICASRGTRASWRSSSRSGRATSIGRSATCGTRSTTTTSKRTRSHVLETLSPIERQTTSQQGRVYIARLSPYRTDERSRRRRRRGDVRRRHGAQAGGGRAPREPAAARARARGDSPASRDDPERRDGAEPGRGARSAGRRRRGAARRRPGARPALRSRDPAAPDRRAPRVRGAVSRAVRLGGARRSLDASARCCARATIAQIPDVAEHEADESLRRLAVQAGYRAVQSTPLDQPRRRAARRAVGPVP